MIYTKRSLGQNFLKDLNIIKKITGITKIVNKDVVEIGPGEGALTNEIVKNNPKSLTLIEKDDSLFKKLKLKYINNNKVTKPNGMQGTNNASMISIGIHYQKQEIKSSLI